MMIFLLLQATVKAFEKVYPTTQQTLSDVHWKRNVRKKIQELGLQSAYDSGDNVLQDYVRTIWTVREGVEKYGSVHVHILAGVDQFPFLFFFLFKLRNAKPVF